MCGKELRAENGKETRRLRSLQPATSHSSAAPTHRVHEAREAFVLVHLEVALKVARDCNGVLCGGREQGGRFHVDAAPPQQSRRTAREEVRAQVELIDLGVLLQRADLGLRDAKRARRFPAAVSPATPGSTHLAEVDDEVARVLVIPTTLTRVEEGGGYRVCGGTRGGDAMPRSTPEERPKNGPPRRLRGAKRAPCTGAHRW